MKEPLLAAIHDAIDAGRDPGDAMAVYGDWLQTRGEPHGELIAACSPLAEVGRDASERESLQAVSRSLQDRLVPELLGISRSAMGGLYYVLHHGFIDYLELTDGSHLNGDFVASLLAREVCAFLRILDLRVYGELGRVPTSAMPAMAACRHLRELELQNFQLWPDDVESLAGLVGLSALHLLGCDLPRASLDLEWLESLPALEELGLSSTELSPAGYERICRMSRLEHLELSLGNEAPARALACLTRLMPRRHFELSVGGLATGCLSQLQNPDMFAAFAAHERFELWASGVELNAHELGLVARLPSLRSLRLSNVDIGAGHLEALGRARKLDTLSLSNVRARGSGLAGALPELPELRTLILSLNRWPENGPLGWLPRLPRVESLMVYGFPWDEPALLDLIAGCPSLRIVKLFGRDPPPSGARQAQDRLRAALPECAVMI